MQPAAKGVFERIWAGVPATYRPFDIYRNPSGAYMFYWAPAYDWHIGFNVCTNEDRCDGVMASALPPCSLPPARAGGCRDTR